MLILLSDKHGAALNLIISISNVMLSLNILIKDNRNELRMKKTQ